MAPGVHLPVAITIINGFYRHSIGIGKADVEVGCAPQRFKSHGIVGVLPISGHLRKSDVVIPCRGTASAVFPPVSVRCLLLSSEAMQDAGAKILPIFVAECAAAKKNQSGPRSKVIGRGPDIRRVVPR